MLLVFGGAKLLGEVAGRVGIPAIAGEILAGILLGPALLNWVAPSEFLTSLADLGVMFLLFRVGLEVRTSELLSVGTTALTAALGGVIVPLLAGFALMRLQGQPSIEAWFVGAAMVATSVGITANVLAERGLLNQRASRIILVAAVIDDVLGLLVLAVVSSMAKGSVNLVSLASTAGIAIAFVLLVVFWGSRAANRAMPRMRERLRVAESEFVVAMTLLFGLSVLAASAGVAAIIGAFLAGMALSETATHRVHTLTDGAAALLVPFFLVNIGLRMDASVFGSLPAIVGALAVLIVAILTKLVGCGLGAWRLGRKDAVRVGVGMIPRGEVGMVVAQIGLQFGVIPQTIYASTVFMSVATTIVAPPLLKWAFRDAAAELEMQRAPVAAEAEGAR